MLFSESSELMQVPIWLNSKWITEETTTTLASPTMLLLKELLCICWTTPQRKSNQGKWWISVRMNPTTIIATITSTCKTTKLTWVVRSLMQRVRLWVSLRRTIRKMQNMLMPSTRDLSTNCEQLLSRHSTQIYWKSIFPKLCPTMPRML